MRITADDIAGMASPGWEGCGSDLEVLDLEEVLDEGYSELAFADAARERDEPEPEVPETEEKPIRYIDGCREGLSTLEICTRLKNERMTGKNRQEQEFLAILQTYPKNGADLKILMWLAAGFSCWQIGTRLERSEKTIRNAARRLRQFRDHGTVKILPADRVQTGEALLKPFPQSRAGRPSRTKIKITTAEVIELDLFGNPVPPCRPRKPRKVGPCRPRARPPCLGQLAFAFAMAA